MMYITLKIEPFLKKGEGLRKYRLIVTKVMGSKVQHRGFSQ